MANKCQVRSPVYLQSLHYLRLAGNSFLTMMILVSPSIRQKLYLYRRRRISLLKCTNRASILSMPRYRKMHQGTSVSLPNWVRSQRMNQKQFVDFLAVRKLIISPQTCSALVHGLIAPGPRFREIFKEITGIKLAHGFVENEE